MKKELTRIAVGEIYHCENGQKILGAHKDIRGNVSGILGNVSGILGNVSGIEGNVSGIEGNVSGISGDVDLCAITSEERAAGVNIGDLVKGK